MGMEIGKIQMIIISDHQWDRFLIGFDTTIKPVPIIMQKTEATKPFTLNVNT